MNIISQTVDFFVSTEARRSGWNASELRGFRQNGERSRLVCNSLQRLCL